MSQSVAKVNSWNWICRDFDFDLHANVHDADRLTITA